MYKTIQFISTRSFSGEITHLFFSRTSIMTLPRGHSRNTLSIIYGKEIGLDKGAGKLKLASFYTVTAPTPYAAVSTTLRYTGCGYGLPSLYPVVKYRYSNYVFIAWRESYLIWCLIPTFNSFVVTCVHVYTYAWGGWWRIDASELFNPQHRESWPDKIAPKLFAFMTFIRWGCFAPDESYVIVNKIKKKCYVNLRNWDITTSGQETTPLI